MSWGVVLHVRLIRRDSLLYSVSTALLSLISHSCVGEVVPYYHVKHWIRPVSFSFQLGCNDVVLFWRIQKMLQTTSNAIRQQVMNHEGKAIFLIHSWIISSHPRTPKELKKYSLGLGMEWNPAAELGRFENKVTSWEFAWLFPGLWGACVTQFITDTTIYSVKERGKGLWDEKKAKKDTSRNNKFSRNIKFYLSLEGLASGYGEISRLRLASEGSPCVPRVVYVNGICFHLHLSVYNSNCTFLINDWNCYLRLMCLTCRSSPTRKRSKTSARWD